MGLILLVSSAFLHALWNSWVKGQKLKEAFLTAVICLATLYSWLGVLIGGFDVHPGKALHWAMFSGVFEGLYLVTLAYALRQAPLSWAYALMRGGAMALVWVVSTSFLGEKIAGTGAVGVALILIALWIPVVGAGDSKQSPKAVLSALFCSLFIAGYHLCYDEAMTFGISPRLLFAVSLTLSLPFTFGNVILRRQLRETFALFRRKPVLIALSGVVVYASFMLFLWGLQTTGPGFAISIRNTSIFFALVFAGLMGEKVSRYQTVTCVLIFIGALLLGWGK